MAKSRARGDEGLVPEIGLRLEHRRVRQQPRFAILRCAKLKKPANLAASLQHTFRERETLNADLKGALPELLPDPHRRNLDPPTP